MKTDLGLDVLETRDFVARRYFFRTGLSLHYLVFILVIFDCPSQKRTSVSSLDCASDSVAA